MDFQASYSDDQMWQWQCQWYTWYRNLYPGSVYYHTSNFVHWNWHCQCHCNHGLVIVILKWK